MKKCLYTLLVGLGCTMLPLAVSAQNNTGKQYQLLFQSGAVTPEANTNGVRKLPVPASSEIVDGTYFRIVQFWQIPTGQQKQQVKKLGVQLQHYLPHNAYFAALPVNVDAEALASAGVRAVVKLEASKKLSAALNNHDYPAWAVTGNTHIDLVVQYYPSVNPARAENLLNRDQIEVLSRYDFSNQVTVRVPISYIDQLAELPFISYIEPIDPPAEPENLVGRTSHRSNAIATDYAMGRHYNGFGVQVALGDDGIIGPHIDYQGRADQSNVFSNGGDHGDHVAGIIMGAGNLNPKTRGMAFGADLHVYDVWDAINMTPNTYISPGIRITSLSYGNGCNAGYTSFARTADRQTREMPSLIHVFSAGNSGTSNCNYGAGSGWGNITGGVKVGKNVIAVANLSSLDAVSNSSSRGPAHDGRIKPDISAVGTSVFSTDNPNTYSTKSGTSMACPGVSGTLAQLYQAYRELNNGTDPEAGLIKSVAMNTADDLGNAGPDFTYGFGRINALRAVRVLEDQTYFTDSATQGSSQSFQITVPAGTGQVKAMLYWTDYEGASNASIALVNDLNMQMVAPNGTSYDPWVLNHTANSSALNSPATRGIDNLNNVEQVTLNNPAAGTYTINVSGFAVPQGPQTYYVVYTFLNAAPELTYPIGGESFVPGEEETIRWDAYGTSGSFTLEYSADSGATWNTIATNIPGTRRYYNWAPPATLVTGQALVKISRGAFADTSNAVFTIIRVPTALNFEYICNDSLKFEWFNVPGATGYEVSVLGQKYMDSLTTTTATSVVLYGFSTTQPDWFSVRAIGPDNGYGRRAVAKQKQTGTLNCTLPDVAILNITSPVPGCFSGNNARLCVTFQNLGPMAVNNLEVGVSVDNGMPVIVPLPITLWPGGTTNYCFDASLLHLPASGPLQISASIIMPGDANPANNIQTVTPVLMLPPVVSISYSGSGNHFSFSSLAPAGSSYNWSFGDGGTSTLPSPTHSYTADSTYSVTLIVTDSSGCSSSVSETISVITGASSDLNQKITLYPNPATGHVVLQSPIATEGTMQVEVINMLGMVVHRATATSARHKLNLHHLPAGSYVIKLTGSSQTFTAPLILQR